MYWNANQFVFEISLVRLVVSVACTCKCIGIFNNLSMHNKRSDTTYFIPERCLSKKEATKKPDIYFKYTLLVVPKTRATTYPVLSCATFFRHSVHCQLSANRRQWAFHSNRLNHFPFVDRLVCIELVNSMLMNLLFLIVSRKKKPVGTCPLSCAFKLPTWHLIPTLWRGFFKLSVYKTHIFVIMRNWNIPNASSADML